MEGRISEACQFDTFLRGGMRCRPTARYGPAQKTSCPRQTGIRKNGQEAKPVGTEFSVDTVHTRLCAEGTPGFTLPDNKRQGQASRG